jgi:hypothetical protein
MCPFMQVCTPSLHHKHDVMQMPFRTYITTTKLAVINQFHCFSFFTVQTESSIRLDN